MRALIRTLTVALPLLALAAPDAAAGCRADTWEVSGVVLDASGHGLAGAAVHLLLDRVSHKKFAAEGVRAQRTRTDANGRFSRTIVCGGSPNPCARRPKHLTMIVDAGGRTTLRQFKLSELETEEGPSSCRLRVPPWDTAPRR
jgi:protocatechuate 3,4-dioxygenase beta subunit